MVMLHFWGPIRLSKPNPKAFLASFRVDRLFCRLAIFVVVCGSSMPAVASASRHAAKKNHHKGKTAHAAKRFSAPSARMSGAFISSTSLKPMASQLLSNRSPEAYQAVEFFAKEHAKNNQDAAALAWLALGYAHLLDKDYEKSLSALNYAAGGVPELDDYIDYFKAQALQGMKSNLEAISAVSSFDQKHPESLFLRDAALLRARAMAEENNPIAAIGVLESHREPPRADIELALGNAYQASGQLQKAAEAFRRIYYTMPMSGEAADARTQLSLLKAPMGGPVDLRVRADLLFKGHRYAEAASEYQQLAADADGNSREELYSALGASLFAARRILEAADALGHGAPASTGLQAQRLYYLAESARGRDDLAEHASLIANLRELAPSSPWLEEALFSAANFYLLRRNFVEASGFYTEIFQRFHNGKHAAYAHWKATWLTQQMGKSEEAARLMEEQVDRYPSSADVPAALYWRGRYAEDRRDFEVARAYYEKLSGRFKYYYYADLARQRLSSLDSGTKAAEISLLNSIPEAPAPPASQELSPPAGNLSLQKSRLLVNAGLFPFAVKELQAATSDNGAIWPKIEIARVYADGGQPHRALETIKQFFPAYLSLSENELPKELWNLLFPRPYWGELKKFADANQLDPYLVSALIRQESEFNASAVSRARALGLMQLLPSVGQQLAHQLGLRDYSTNSLFVPTINIELGTLYFRGTLQRFNGKLPYALAAYNAGSERVRQWEAADPTVDVAAFVESIPFTETREYVQAILRNANMYRRLYGAQ